MHSSNPSDARYTRSSAPAAQSIPDWRAQSPNLFSTGKFSLFPGTIFGEVASANGQARAGLPEPKQAPAVNRQDRKERLFSKCVSSTLAPLSIKIDAAIFADANAHRRAVPTGRAAISPLTSETTEFSRRVSAHEILGVPKKRRAIVHATACLRRRKRILPAISPGPVQPSALQVAWKANNPVR